MILRNKLTALTIFVLLFVTSFSFSQTTTSNIVLGQSIAIDSKILNETREIFIYTPEGYNQSNDNYAVIYVLDGESKFFIATAINNFLATNGRMPRTIVVGIPNVARNRDLTPNIGEQPINTGGVDNFIKFLEEEVMAFVNKAYRTHDFNILFGHSYGGMFSVYTLFTNPDLFDAHIAASPSLMFGDEFVVQKVEEILANESKFNNQIYMSIGDEPNYYASLDKLTALLTKNDSGLTWTLEKYADEDHGSIPFRTIADGLEFVYADWQLPNETAMK
ncbi:MAG: alpha/beta hydrolase-fold protein, partial [Candidatus Neomarinimicrobiota bacterium]